MESVILPAAVAMAQVIARCVIAMAMLLVIQNEIDLANISGKVTGNKL